MTSPKTSVRNGRMSETPSRRLGYTMAADITLIVRASASQAIWAAWTPSPHPEEYGTTTSGEPWIPTDRTEGR